MKSLAIFAEILSTSHKSTHRFENGEGSLGDLIPGPLQTSNRGCAQRRDDGCKRGEVV